jgi:hypothetical protein
LIGVAGVIASNSSCETCPKTTPPNYSAEPISIEHRNLSQFAEQNDVSEIGFGGVYREVSISYGFTRHVASVSLAIHESAVVPAFSQAVSGSTRLSHF